MTRLLRHVSAVQNYTLPGDRLPFRVADQAVGWVPAAEGDFLESLPFGCRQADGSVVLPDPADLPALARGVADRGRTRWRGEAFDVRAQAGGAVLTTIDRGALPFFGIRAEGVHVNGFVCRADGLHVWIAQRAADRLLDPGKLDHLFAGGIAAGMDAQATLFKEGQEEAGLGPEIVARAVPAGWLRYTTLRPEGLRRDRLHCYDLALPEDVVPHACDGEVEDFTLWPAARVIHTLRETDRFKFNVALVLIDFLLRWGLLRDCEEMQAATDGFRH
jgi:hypothetical protein